MTTFEDEGRWDRLDLAVGGSCAAFGTTERGELELRWNIEYELFMLYRCAAMSVLVRSLFGLCTVGQQEPIDGLYQMYQGQRFDYPSVRAESDAIPEVTWNVGRSGLTLDETREMDRVAAAIALQVPPTDLLFGVYSEREYVAFIGRRDVLRLLPRR